jgi:DNA-binding GntR family transcriptional regulator
LLKEQVYRSLKHKIVVQDMKPGARLNEKAIMQEYSIGKTPLREIFLRLQRDGLIRRFPRSGPIVAPIDFKELRDAAEIRLALEGLVGTLACRRITPAILVRMRELIAVMESRLRDGASEEFIAAETSLHSILYDMTDNDKLKTIIAEQHNLFARLWFSVEQTGLDLAGQIEDWRDLCNALAARDEFRACEASLKHFRTSYNHLRVQFY